MIISEHLQVKWILRDENREILYVASGSVRGLELLSSQDVLKPFLAAYPETVEIETLLVLEKRLLENYQSSTGKARNDK